MFKRVGKMRYLCPTPTVVLNYSSVLPCTYSFIIARCSMARNRLVKVRSIVVYWWIFFAPDFRYCYFCEPSCMFYLSFNFDLLTSFPGCLRLGLSWFNWWVSFAPEFQCCYFCESSCLFYLSFNFDLYVSKIKHL